MTHDDDDRLLRLAGQAAAGGCRECSNLLEQLRETQSDKDMQALSLHLRGPAHTDALDPALVGLAAYVALQALEDDVTDDDADEGEDDDDDW